MAALNPLLAVVNSLLVAAVGIVLLVWTAGGWPHLLPAPEWVSAILSPSTPQRWVGGLVGAVLVLSGLHVAWHALVPRRREAPSVATELGLVTTALSAIEDLARRAGLQVAGVRELRPRVQLGRDGLQVTVGAEVDPDHRVPEVAPVLQTRLRETIEGVVGSRVAEVRVVVERIGADRPLRRP